jgi:hypothetical protein
MKYSAAENELHKYSMKFLLQQLIIGCFLFSCSPTRKPTISDIYPISPFRHIKDFRDEVSDSFKSRAVVDFYVVYGSISDTSYISKLLIEFAGKNIDKSVLIPPTRYELRFYKKSRVTNKEFKESHFDLIDYHNEDHFATITILQDGDPYILFTK